jgi:multidrug efflux system membrane fusion protein
MDCQSVSHLPTPAAQNRWQRIQESAMPPRTPFSGLGAVALALAAAAILAACGDGRGDAKAQAGPPPPPPVSVAAAIEKEVIESDEFPGRVEAIEQVEVRARINGYLQSAHFKPGAEVKKGDLLFTIDPRPFEAQVAAAESQIASTRAQLELARTELARNEQMWADRATSKREFDDAATRVRTLEAQLRANEAALTTVRLNLSYTRIVAPISGRVSKAEITPGNLIQGEMPPSPVLTTVVSVNPVYVSFQADESAYLKYIAGSRSGALAVAVGLADEDGFPHPGKLEFVDNRVDPASGTVRMRATVDNSKGRFTPGLFARVRLGDSARPRKAVLVADRAIGTDQSKRFVLVVGAENKAEYREVRIGRLADGLRVIESGLKPGEVIVVNGLQRVRPGAPVTPQTVPMAGENGNGRGGAASKTAG